MAEHNNENVMKTLLQSMDSVLAAKTVVGNPMQVGEVTILPLMDVSFGFGAGNADSAKGGGSTAGGVGGKLTPSAVLVIKDGAARIVNVKSQDTVGKFVDMLPDLIDKVTGKFKGGVSDAEIVDKAFPEKNI